jgi:hypothetical protein
VGNARTGEGDCGNSGFAQGRGYEESASLAVGSANRSRVGESEVLSGNQKLGFLLGRGGLNAKPTCIHELDRKHHSARRQLEYKHPPRLPAELIVVV